MISYKKLLENNNIYDIDYISETGEFYREFRDLNDNVAVGYKGFINYDENGVHLIYTKQERLSYESYLEDTPLFNIDYSNKLIIYNYEGQTSILNLSNNELRNYNELFEEYMNNTEAFLEKQKIMMEVENLNDKINNIENKKKILIKKIDEINQNFHHKL